MRIKKFHPLQNLCRLLSPMEQGRPGTVIPCFFHTVPVKRYGSALLLGATLLSCNNESPKQEVARKKEEALSCMRVPSRIAATGKASYNEEASTADSNSRGMVYIPGGEFLMGGDNAQASADELPKHIVTVKPFLIDVTEVTNAQFQQFVDATGYVTTAERKPDESVLVPSSLVFHATSGPVDLNDYSQWWSWVNGANWKHPEGPGSSIKGKENYPVVHVSWYDAQAYCKWAGKRLPTEAEWEFAARGGKQNGIYAWDNEPINNGHAKMNSWEGDFPYRNQQNDHYVTAAPVKSYEPNGYGLFDMSGNVWE